MVNNLTTISEPFGTLPDIVSVTPDTLPNIVSVTPETLPDIVNVIPKLVENITSFANCTKHHPVAIYYKWLLMQVFQYFLGSIGIVGNIISIIILSIDKKKTFNFLLVTLACFDTIFILCSFVMFLKPEFMGKFVIYKFFAPLYYVSLSCSTFMTVGISAERYIGIVLPFYHHSCEMQPRRFIIPTIIIGVLINIPQFLVRDVKYTNNTYNKTIINVVRSETSKDPIFISYLQLSTLIVDFIIPFISLLYLNFSICYRISSRWGIDQNKHSINEWRKAFILFAIVAIFLLCHSPWGIHQLYHLLKVKSVQDQDCIKVPLWDDLLVHSGHFLMVFNSSINFIIYCWVGSKFKSDLVVTILWMWKSLAPGPAPHLEDIKLERFYSRTSTSIATNSNNTSTSNASAIRQSIRNN